MEETISYKIIVNFVNKKGNYDQVRLSVNQKPDEGPIVAVFNAIFNSDVVSNIKEVFEIFEDIEEEN